MLMTREEKRQARFNELKKLSKPALLARMNELHRVHGADLKTPKMDMVCDILTAELGRVKK